MRAKPCLFAVKSRLPVISSYCHNIPSSKIVFLWKRSTISGPQSVVRLCRLQILKVLQLFKTFMIEQVHIPVPEILVHHGKAPDEIVMDPVFAKYKRLNEALVGVVEDYSLVSFTAVSVHNKESMLRVKNATDKANGYVFGKEEERSMESLMSCAVGAEFEYQKIQDIQEKYVDTESSVTMDDQDL